MSPDQFERVKALFDRAMSLSPEARPAFLLEACPDDEEVRMEVERILGQVTESDLLDDARRAVANALETAGTRSDRGDVESRNRLIGRMLSHYRVLEELGRGGMGIVYRALDVRLNREVALKMLPAHLVSDPDRKRRFVREAQSAAALKHPNIAVVYEIDEVDGETLIAMELIEGETLTDVLARGPLPLQRALEIARDVANGLGTAHEKGIVHRDVKPGNIMIAEDGHAKVIDFGLSKLLPPGGLQDDAGTETRGDAVTGGPPAPPGGQDTSPCANNL